MSFHANIAADQVAVTVACTVTVQETSLLPLPGHLTITSTATEARDRYREAPP
jgi:hypothetical protein